MRLTGKERRTLAEIEDALVRDDPTFAKQLAAINRIEAGDIPARPASRTFWPLRIEHRVVFLLLTALGVISLLVIAVLLT